MKLFIAALLSALPLLSQAAPRAGPPGERASRGRVVESIVPWLAYNSSCSSSIRLQNLGNREVDAEVEAHKSSGALAPFAGQSGIAVHLAAGARVEYKLQLTEHTTGAWVRLRETVPSPQLSAVLAVSGATECLTGDELRTTAREVAWPARSPWFSGDVSAGGKGMDDDGILAVINASERPARVSGCYSAGVLYSLPGTQLTPVCSDTIDELIAPFGSAQFPVMRGGNSHFSLSTRGEAIVLQMLRPAAAGIKLYKVDSSITFGKEVPDK